MRSSALFLFVALCACGNLSNEDVAFLEAIPQKEALQVQVPNSALTAQPSCALGPAAFFQSAKQTGDDINQGVSGLLELVDTIRAQPPTARDTDSRTWGPFPDQSHPGFQTQVQMVRQVDATGTPWRWDYSISEAPPGGAFLAVVEGTFFGAQAKSGTGRITLHFERSVQLGIAKATDPKFPMRIFYDLGDDPRTISLDLTEGEGFGVPSFDYSYEGFLDGHGQFAFAVAGGNGCTTEVTTQFTAAGAGKDSFHVRCGPFVSAEAHQCWDANACLSFIDDPLAATAACNGVKPCLLGNAASCPGL
ncbi:MAG TPA: hypothetical protein VGH20_20095 [Myxococcales bacterium]|jgi:hypothetical protein